MKFLKSQPTLADAAAKVHLVYLCARFYPHKGGAEQNTWELATRAAQAGYQVTVLTTDVPLTKGGQSLVETEQISGLTIIRAHSWNRWLTLGFAPSMLPKLLNLKADIIHYQNGPGFIWQEWCLVIKKLLSFKTKIIATPHGPFLSTISTHTGPTWLVASLGKVIGSIYFIPIWSLLFTRVIAVNPEQYKWMRSRYWISPAKVRLIPNGIDAQIIEPQVPTKRPPVGISFVGRLAIYKGVQQVIKALGMLKQKGRHDFKFYAMGHPGNALSEIRDLIAQFKLENNVEILLSPGDKERDEVLKHKSQIHILPSQWEATGIVLLEAMAKGNAIITTTGNEAHKLLIEEGQNGFTYQYSDISALNDILTQLLGNQGLRQKMIESNLQKVQQFTWERIFPKYLDVLTELVRT